MRRATRQFLGLLALLAWPGGADARTQKPKLDIQIFRPAPGALGFLGVESGDVNSHLGLSAGLNLNYGLNPLAVQVVDDDGDAVGDDIGVVKNRLDANFMAALGFFDMAELGLVLPLVTQSGLENNRFTDLDLDPGASSLKSFTVGDVRLVPKVRFAWVEEGRFAAALLANITLPTAGGTLYAGEASYTAEPALALSSRSKFLRSGLQVGVKLRQKSVNIRGADANGETAYNLTFADELTYKLAAALRPGEGSLEVVGELYGQSPLDKPFGLGFKGDNKTYGKAKSPAEGMVGIRLPIGQFSLLGGFGGGLMPGVGAAVPRVFAGVQYYNGAIGRADADKDGVPDAADQCPDKKEDLDKFQDEDGCPEADNDSDRVLDEDDQCPLEPEEHDGYNDADGCPDPDNDEDGFLDAADQCPVQAEDKDGFEDEDGCPEFDNDKDGVADPVDKCPQDAEDVDAFQDADGCPEPDNDNDGLSDLGDLCPNHAEDKDNVADDDGCPEENDGDGILDADDKCPNEAETYNGIEDEDGCPEKLKTKSLVEVTQEKIEIKETIFFKSGSATILPKSFNLMDQVAAVLKNYKHITKVRIEGHTDAAGNKKQNIKLSQERAEAVLKYLVSKGVAAERLEAKGYGPDKPIASNRTARGRDMNRRVEFVIAEQKQIGQDVSESEPKIEMQMEMPATPDAGGGAEPTFELNVGDDAQGKDAKPDKGGAKKKGKKGDKPEAQDAGGEVQFQF